MTEQSPLTKKYTHAPFSILDTRQGEWQRRRREWLSLGIKSEIGRDAVSFTNQRDLNKIMGRPTEEEHAEKERKALGAYAAYQGAVLDRAGGGITGTSVFDPVLCELMYSWFSASGGAVLDPFAGGSVRGIVAGILGRIYTGIDLSGKQVDANRIQASEIQSRYYPEMALPVWACGDSLQLNEYLPADYRADFIFSCPPYLNLEQYSDNPKDLSTMDDAGFYLTYYEIIAKAIKRLKNDRFACFVISEVRSKNGVGEFRKLLNNTVYAFEDAGAKFYNEAILVNSCGTLPVRIAKQFEGARKLGRHHQNIYIFIKGDPKKAAEACGKVSIPNQTQQSLDFGGDDNLNNDEEMGV